MGGIDSFKIDTGKMLVAIKISLRRITSGSERDECLRVAILCDAILQEAQRW